MKVAAIIQARMGSTRLSGKVMKELCGQTILSHVIERVKQSKYIEEIIIATTVLERDNIIVEEATKNNVNVFRGSESDVLSRYYFAAKENEIDIVVRITSDCPLIDPKIIDELFQYYQNNNIEIVTNAGLDINQRTYPRGLDVEVFSYEILDKAYKNAKENYQREHVTPYIYENASKVVSYKNEEDYSGYRWTLDTEEDFELIERIYNSLYRGKHDFYLSDIIKLVQKNPELEMINKHIEQKKIN